MRRDLKYRFTADWTTPNFPNWEKWLGHFAGQPTYVLEIGTYEGRSAFWFVDNILTHEDSCIVTIDMYRNPHFVDNVKRFPGRDKIWSIQGTSDWLRDNNPGFFDLIYIDGDHSEEWVTRDIENVLPFTKEGTLLLFDDYATFPGVRAAVSTFLGKVHGWEIVAYGHQFLVRLGSSSTEGNALPPKESPPEAGGNGPGENRSGYGAG